MINFIGNSCIASYMTSRICRQQFINPFCWCIMDFDSCYNLVSHYNDINYHNIKLQNSNWDFSILVDNIVKIQFVHYKFDPNVQGIQVNEPDVLSNQIWVYIIDKYIQRTQRMVTNSIKPTFIFAGAKSAINLRSTFTLDQQARLNELNTNYDIYCSFGDMIHFTNPKIHPLIQHQPYTGNTLAMALDLHRQMLQA